MATAPTRTSGGQKTQKESQDVGKGGGYRWPHENRTNALIFFSLPFWKTARKTIKKARISYACQTPKILGKEGENAQNRKEFLEKEKGKKIQNGKEKKIRVDPFVFLAFFFFLFFEG